MSQTPAFAGHEFMTNNPPNSPDLLAIAREAEIEVEAAETVQLADATSSDATRALSTAELGYYEAELTSLHNAATTLYEAERRSNDAAQT